MRVVFISWKHLSNNWIFVVAVAQTGIRHRISNTCCEQLIHKFGCLTHSFRDIRNRSEVIEQVFCGSQIKNKICNFICWDWNEDYQICLYIDYCWLSSFNIQVPNCFWSVLTYLSNFYLRWSLWSSATDLCMRSAKTFESSSSEQATKPEVYKWRRYNVGQAIRFHQRR